LIRIKIQRVFTTFFEFAAILPVRFLFASISNDKLELRRMSTVQKKVEEPTHVRNLIIATDGEEVLGDHPLSGEAKRRRISVGVVVGRNGPERQIFFGPKDRPSTDTGLARKLRRSRTGIWMDQENLEFPVAPHLTAP
jgi:hypothetical protein